MAVKLYEEQVQNASSIESKINQYLADNPGAQISHIAISQGQDSGELNNVIVIVDFTVRKVA